MSTGFEERLRAELEVEQIEIPLDADRVLAQGRRTVRVRRWGAAVTGAALLALVVSVLTPLVLGRGVPAVPAPAPVATPSATPAPKLLGTAWTGVSVDGRPLIPGKSITLEFTATGAAGSDGCNGFSQEHSAGFRQDGYRLTIGGVAGGLALCVAPAGVTEQANRLRAALQNTVSFRIDAGRLVLLDDAGANLAEFDPFEVDGRTWHLESSTGSWVGKDPVITLQVDGDRAWGNSGCGDYTAALTRDGNDWRLSEATIAAPIPCPSDASERMSRFLRLLEQTASAQPWAPDRLRLVTPDGDLTFTIER